MNFIGAGKACLELSAGVDTENPVSRVDCFQTWTLMNKKKIQCSISFISMVKFEG